MLTLRTREKLAFLVFFPPFLFFEALTAFSENFLQAERTVTAAKNIHASEAAVLHLRATAE